MSIYFPFNLSNIIYSVLPDIKSSVANDISCEYMMLTVLDFFSKDMLKYCLFKLQIIMNPHIIHKMSKSLENTCHDFR